MQITKTTFRGGPISSHPAIAPMLAATSIDLGQDSCAIDYLVFNAFCSSSVFGLPPISKYILPQISSLQQIGVPAVPRHGPVIMKPLRHST